MMEVEYFTYPGVKGRYFRCDALRANLADHRCASMYREAKKMPSGECLPIEKCIGCQIGAAHAGDSAPQHRGSAIGILTCCRCHQQASRIVCGGICVSCFNREKEVATGRNAKGMPPRPVERFWDDEFPSGKVVFTHRVGIGVSLNGTPRNVSFDRVADTFEAVLRSVRGVRDPIFLFRTAPILPGCSGSLFGGVFRQKTKRRIQKRRSMTSFIDQPGQLLLMDCA